MGEALIIDDNRSTADALVQMMELLHAPARVAYGSSAALAILGSFTPNLIVLDITMPGVDGLEVLGFLRREPRLATIPVLVVTLDDQPETREKALRRGANAFITKPATLPVLEDSLRKLGVIGVREARDAPAISPRARDRSRSRPAERHATPSPAPLAAGHKAPDFELPDDTGKRLRLSDFRGRPVVLYFYPADDTPGCVKEACGFRDDFSDYERAGVPILGVSPDDVVSHGRFKAKYGLTFRLLADVGHRVASLYGVWGRKKFMGREYEGVLRTTFLIDKNGLIARVFERVRPATHSEEVLEVLRSM